MQNMIRRPTQLCSAVRTGVANLAYAAAAAYGTGKKVLYPVATGEYASTASFSELVEKAAFVRTETACAAALLRQCGVPEQGVKTALLLLDALLERGTQSGCTDNDWRQLGHLIDYAVVFLGRIAGENHGQVTGGGLTMLTLCRPVQKYGREQDCERATGVLVYALEQPLLKLADAAGLDGYEVFERVKALAPNQFFSLHQVGIERSIQTTPAHTDYIHIGLDVQSGTICDLCEAGKMVDGKTAEGVLQFVGRALTAITDTAAVIE